MLSNEVEPLLLCIFSDAQKSYDATPALEKIDLSLALPLLKKLPGHYVERRIINFIYAQYEETGCAPSWQSYAQWFSNVINSLDPLEKQPKDADFPSTTEIPDIQHIAHIYQTEANPIGLPGDAPARHAAYLSALRKAIALENNIKFMTDLGKGKDFATAVGELNSELMEAVDPTTTDRPRSSYENPALAEEIYWESFYRREKQRPIYCGMETIDGTVDGFDAGEFVGIIGAASAGKSTLALNWTLQALMNGRNGLYLTLEMNPDRTLNKIYSMLSRDPKFEGHPPVAASDIDKTRLTQESFDLMYGPDGIKDYFLSLPGRLTIRCLKGMGLPEIQTALNTADTDPDYPLSYFVLDHAGLLQAPIIKNATVNLCEERLFQGIAAICDGHKGHGLCGIMAAQASKAGHEKASKNNGIYDFGCAARSVEIERSCTQLYGVYHDAALKAAKESVISSWKSRNTETPPAFTISVDTVTGCMTEDRVDYSSWVEPQSRQPPISSYNL